MYCHYCKALRHIGPEGCPMWAGATPLHIHFPTSPSFTLSFTFHFFLSYSLYLFSYFSTPSLSTRMGSLHFQAGGCRVQPNLGLVFLWSPYVIKRPYIFASCNFFLFFFSPNLSGRTLDVYHTSTHGVALVRIQNAGLKCAACGSLKMQDPKKSPKIAIWAPSHNFVGL